jgi:hypothetical protein
MPCLVVAAVVCAGPLALWGFAQWFDALGHAGPGGVLVQFAVSCLVCLGVGWLALRLALDLLGRVWAAVGGPLMVGRRLVAATVGAGAHGRAGVRPQAGRVPGGRSPASPIPEGDTGDGGRASPGDGPGAVGDAAGREAPGSAPVAPPVPRHPDEPGEQAWLIDRLVPYGPVREGRCYATGLVAKRGTAKSYLAVDAAVALCTGGAWMGHRCRRCASVLYGDLELDAETFWRRAWAVARGRGLDRPPPNLHYLDLSAHTLRVPTEEEAERERRRRAARWGGLGGTADALAALLRWAGAEATWGCGGMERLWLRCRAVRAQACVVDSLTLGGGVALGDHDGWRRLLRRLERFGIPVLAVDHTDKTGESGMVGAFTKEGLVRSVLQLERLAPGRIAVTATKSNFGPALPPWTVRDAFAADATGRLVAVTFARAVDPAPPATLPHAPQHAPTSSLVQERPAPTPLPRRTEPPATPARSSTPRPELHLVAPGGDRTPEGLRGHAAIDARVLATVRAGAPADKAALGAQLAYSPKTVANSLSRLRKAGALPRPEPRPAGHVGDVGGVTG